MAKNPTVERYILCGKVLSTATPTSPLELAMLELLRSCDAIWIKSEKIAQLISGDRFVPLSEIAKAIDVAEIQAFNRIGNLRSGGLKIEGTAERGYRLHS